MGVVHTPLAPAGERRPRENPPETIPDSQTTPIFGFNPQPVMIVPAHDLMEKHTNKMVSARIGTRKGD